MTETNENLWHRNIPAKFWLCETEFAPESWEQACAEAARLLELPDAGHDVDTILAQTLGEMRFGPKHWTLDASKRIYYMLKPALPRGLVRWMRRWYSRTIRKKVHIPWPVDARYVNFLWETLRQEMCWGEKTSAPFKSFWPGHNRFALVLTHDIETADGQNFVETVADMEEQLGFRSSFNFVPERYTVNRKLMNSLRERGFEIGIHGLKHDGKMFRSEKIFRRRAAEINAYIRDWNVTGFRADLTLRQPHWMQALDIEYDLSFFDTDPFEPIPGGAMSIWPFFMGRFIVLPYTLVQDYSLVSILGETTPNLWLEKVKFIEQHCGLALINTHPDYLLEKQTWNVYYDFLTHMKNRADCWHALPREAAAWWRQRADSANHSDPDSLSTAVLDGDTLRIIP